MEAKDPGETKGGRNLARGGANDEFMIGTRQASQMLLPPSTALEHSSQS